MEWIVGMWRWRWRCSCIVKRQAALLTISGNEKILELLRGKR